MEIDYAESVVLVLIPRLIEEWTMRKMVWG